MNDVDDFVDAFHTAAKAVPAPPPGDADTIVRRGRRRVLHRTGAVAGGAALVVLVAGVAVSRLFMAGEPDVAAPEVEDVAPPAADDAEPTDRPSGTSDDTGQEPACSAAGMEPHLPQQDLPSPVAEMRQEIADAAVACDYGQLEALVNAGAQFVYSFGGGDDPAGYWQQREADGEPVLADLLTLLGLDHGITDPGDVAGEVYVWPAVFALDAPSRDDFAAVVDAGLYDDEDVDRWLEALGGYGGYRVGIDETGRWRFFVAGD